MWFDSSHPSLTTTMVRPPPPHHLLPALPAGPQVQSSHPNYLRVDNSTDFDGKLDRATEAVLAKLGLAAHAP